MSTGDVAIVVPSIGRPSLEVLLGALGRSAGPRPAELVVVDDRPRATRPLDEAALARLASVPVRVVASGGRGPAAARNTGWRLTDAPWVAFLDDDVVPAEDWLHRLQDDVRRVAPDVGGVQGRVRVPLPPHRRPTDWERHVRGLQDGRWITADMAYRRAALVEVDGFDPAFPRAFREDADLALRVEAAGWRLQVGERRVVHPVGPDRAVGSVRRQLGNADDARMRRRHGRTWRARAGVAAGRRPRHVLVSLAGLGALGALVARRPRPGAVLAALWLGGTAELAWARIAPGPRRRDEVLRMLWTSVLIPPVASAAWLAGLARSLTDPTARAVPTDRGPTDRGRRDRVLCDRGPCDRRSP